MTLEDDRREKFRKDLIKALPIEVEEDSEDERWGFGTTTAAVGMVHNNHQSLMHGNSYPVMQMANNHTMQHNMHQNGQNQMMQELIY